jgi:hypothetical protein
MLELKEYTRYYATGFSRRKDGSYDIEHPWQGKTVIRVLEIESADEFVGESYGAKATYRRNEQGLWINQSGGWYAERLEEIPKC